MPVASFIVEQIDTGLVYVSEYGNNNVSVSKGGKKIVEFSGLMIWLYWIFGCPSFYTLIFTCNIIIND